MSKDTLTTIAASITIAHDVDYFGSHVLADKTTGKRVRFVPMQVQGRGWTVAKIIGSKSGERPGPIAQGQIVAGGPRSCEIVPGYSDTMTMHQADASARVLTRDLFNLISQAATNNG